MQFKSYSVHLFVCTWLSINFFHHEDILSTEIYLYLIAVKIVHRGQVVGNIRNNNPKSSFIKGFEGYHTVSEMISLMLDAILPWRRLLELCSVFRVFFAFWDDSCLLFCVLFLYQVNYVKTTCKMSCNGFFQDLLNSKIT